MPCPPSHWTRRASGLLEAGRGTEEEEAEPLGFCPLIVLIISSHRCALSRIAASVRLELSTVSHSLSAGGEGAGFCIGGRPTRREIASQRLQFHVRIVSLISSGVKATLVTSTGDGGSHRDFFELAAVAEVAEEDADDSSSLS